MLWSGLTTHVFELIDLQNKKRCYILLCMNWNVRLESDMINIYYFKFFYTSKWPTLLINTFWLNLQETNDLLLFQHQTVGCKKNPCHAVSVHGTIAIVFTQNTLVSLLVRYSTRHMKLDKKRESLKNHGTDISRSTICLAKFARHFELWWWYLVPEA